MRIVDDKLDNMGKFWKIRPFIKSILNGCYQNNRPKSISIDEKMIPFHGTVKMKQFSRNKPNPVRLNNLVMCESNGLPLYLFMYEGRNSTAEPALFECPEI